MLFRSKVGWRLKQLARENAVVLSDVSCDVTDDILLQALCLVTAFGNAKIVSRCLNAVSKTVCVGSDIH